MMNWMRACLLLVAVMGLNAAPDDIKDAVGSLNSLVLHADHQITGGVAKPIDEFEYQLGLFANRIYACGASIISIYWALTAAHCTADYAAENLIIHSGSSHITGGGKLHQVYYKISHEKYDYSTYDYDIALLLVFDTFSSTAAIALPPQGLNIPAFTKATVSGWGGTNAIFRYSTYIQAVTIPIATKFRCQMTHTLRITDRMICAGYIFGLLDSCNGDSGSPMVATVGGAKRLVGVVSWGSSCGFPLIPGVYTRVPEFRDWIKKYTGI